MCTSMPRTRIPGILAAIRYSPRALAAAMPNLVAAWPVRVYACGVGVSMSGFTRRATGARRPHGAGQVAEGAQLALALHVEGVDAGAQPRRQLVHRLAHPAEDDALAGDAGQQRAVQLAAGDDVAAGAQLRQRAQDAQVAVGLDRVGDQVRHRRQRLVQLAVALADGALAVDVQRRSPPRHQLRQRHLLAVQHPVHARKRVRHSRDSCILQPVLPPGCCQAARSCPRRRFRAANRVNAIAFCAPAGQCSAFLPVRASPRAGTPHLREGTPCAAFPRCCWHSPSPRP